MEAIYHLPLFVDATDDEVQWLIDHSSIWEVAQGDYFAKEGDPARYFYVVLAGELQITRTVKGQKMVLGTTPRGIMGGETFLLEGSPTLTSVQAIMPSRLMVFDQPNFLRIFTHCPSVGTKILRTAAERMLGFATIVKQQEKMAALGKLSAGLAHELNNPAAAVKRSAATLQKLLPALQTHAVRLNGVGLSSAALEGLVDYLAQLQTRMATNPPLSPLAQSDREAALEEWLDQYVMDNQWEIAATLAAAQVDVAELDRLVETVSAPCVADVMLWLCESLTASSLLSEIAQSTQRISDLVGAIKSYTYMDQGTRQEVDIQRDLDNTLLMLKHKLRNIEVIRQYDPALPRLLARGSELNQVWTNLIDNAIDALAGSGTIWLITRSENHFLMVEVADSGPGIAADVLPHLFEPFFTTKEVGAGTGLGLDITYRIIQQHNGTITVDSRPGHTRFIVRLPQQQPQQ